MRRGSAGSALSLDLPSKAMVLAAGLGTRLRPLIPDLPKCMVPLGNKPLLEYTILWLRKFGVTDIVINLHYLPEVVRGHFGDGARWGARIRYSLEETVLGTAGGVKRVAGSFQGPFFVWYGDNLSTCRLDRLWRCHRAHPGTATLALYYRRDPTHSGIAAFDRRGRITRFIEKPRADQIFSRWVSAGIFVLEPSALDAVPAGAAVDFGRHVFPNLLAQGARLHGYRMGRDEKLVWIDRPEDLRRAEARWKRLAVSFEAS